MDLWRNPGGRRGADRYHGAVLTIGKGFLIAALRCRAARQVFGIRDFWSIVLVIGDVGAISPASLSSEVASSWLSWSTGLLARRTWHRALAYSSGRRRGGTLLAALVRTVRVTPTASAPIGVRSRAAA